MSEAIHGACLCGQITFDVHEPESMGMCHCTRCQRWSGGAGLPVLVVEATNFKVTKGQDLIKQYNEEGFAGRCFCSQCGSNLYGDGGEKYYVGAGSLRDVTLEPAWHIMVGYKAPWDEISGEAVQFQEWPHA